MKENSEKPEVLQRIAEFEAKLAALGISAEKLPEVSALIGERADLQTDLEQYRADQFYEDAQDLYYKIAGQRGGKQQTVATFLRAFAEHVAAYASEARDTKSLVDRIPPMHDPEKG